MHTRSRHLLIDCWDCRGSVGDAATVEAAMRAAVEATGATLLHIHVHAFEPQGVTGVAVLAESHLAVHTWPEHDYLAADLFTCGLSTRPERVVEVLAQRFEPGDVEVREIARGVRESKSQPLQRR